MKENFQSLSLSPERLDVLYSYLRDKLTDEQFMISVDKIVCQNDDLFQSKSIIGLILTNAGVGGKSDDEEAKEAVERIIKAISKYGWMQMEKAKEFIGALGWKCVDMEGGWERVCSTFTTENESFLKKQYIDYCITVISRGKQGRLNEAPTIPRPILGESDKVKKLTEGIGKPIK